MEELQKKMLKERIFEQYAGYGYEEKMRRYRRAIDSFEKKRRLAEAEVVERPSDIDEPSWRQLLARNPREDETVETETAVRDTVGDAPLTSVRLYCRDNDISDRAIEALVYDYHLSEMDELWEFLSGEGMETLRSDVSIPLRDRFKIRCLYYKEKPKHH